MNNFLPENMSPRMYGTLRVFIHNSRHLDHITTFDQRTVLALVLRGYLKLSGNFVEATTKGWNAYNFYHSAKGAMRKPATARQGMTDSVKKSLNKSGRKLKRA